MALHGSTVLPIGSILATIELLELSPAASVLGLWWEAVAESFRVVRDRSGAVVGVSIVIKGDRVPARPAQGDPLVGRWGDHLKRNPLATARGVLFHRRGWTGRTGKPPLPILSPRESWPTTKAESWFVSWSVGAPCEAIRTRERPTSA